MTRRALHTFIWSDAASVTRSLRMRTAHSLSWSLLGESKGSAFFFSERTFEEKKLLNQSFSFQQIPDGLDVDQGGYNSDDELDEKKLEALEAELNREGGSDNDDDGDDESEAGSNDDAEDTENPDATPATAAAAEKKKGKDKGKGKSEAQE